LNTQAKNLVFAGPGTGANAQPSFRALVAADIPALTYVTSIGSSNLSIGGTTAVPTVNLSSTQVTNIGLGATALQSVTTADSVQGAGTAASPIELVGDSTAPGNAKYYGTNGSGTRGWYSSIAVPVVANPSATIGLAAVNGVTGNWMDAGSAPALNQAIAPTWTGQHVFSPSTAVPAIVINGASAATSLSVVSTQGATGANGDITVKRNGSTINTVLEGPNIALWDTTNTKLTSFQNSGGQTELWQHNGVSWSQVWKIPAGLGMTVIAGLGINGNAPAAQSTGWGTPTGGSVQNNYAAGVGATLLATSDAVAQIITVLKAVGILGA
jgi:hypothetical protein